jgi:hypothetical protein
MRSADSCGRRTHAVGAMCVFRHRLVGNRRGAGHRFGCDQVVGSDFICEVTAESARFSTDAGTRVPIPRNENSAV